MNKLTGIMRRAAATAILTVAPLLAVGAVHAEDTLTIAMTAGDVPDWGGQPDQGFEGYRFVSYSIYEPLVGWDLSSFDKEVTLRPDLATEWHIDPDDHTRWIFSLREGITFHDGCPWDADAAVWNLSRLTDQAHPAFSPVSFGRARSRTNNIASIEKVDDFTIAITNNSVESLFPYSLPYVFMISPCAYEQAGNDYDAYKDAPAGTGPFKFDSVVPHERLELVKNDEFWDTDRMPKIDRMILLPMPEATTRAAALLSGQVDWIEAPSPDMIPALEGAGNQVITNRYPHTWPYLLNMQKEPFSDVRVRQAANYAVDREAMTAMLGGIAEPSIGMYIPSQASYGTPFPYTHDVEKAKSLLQEADCYPCEIKVAISTSGSGQMQPLPMNELVKANLEEAGFKVEFEVEDWNTMITQFIQGAVAYPELDAINFSSGASDPLSVVKTFATRYTTPKGSNWGGYSNPEVDALIDEVLTTFDADKQTELLAEIHGIVTEDAARLPVVSDLNPRALAPYVKGFVQAQSWFQDMTPVYIEK